MTLLKPCQCQRCRRRFATMHGLATHEHRCYPLREIPIRSKTAEKRLKRKIALADTRFISGVE
jgi:hypothetical protein